jgi:hypothetical protein
MPVLRETIEDSASEDLRELYEPRIRDALDVPEKSGAFEGSTQHHLIFY